MIEIENNEKDLEEITCKNKLNFVYSVKNDQTGTSLHCFKQPFSSLKRAREESYKFISKNDIKKQRQNPKLSNFELSGTYTVCIYKYKLDSSYYDNPIRMLLFEILSKQKLIMDILQTNKSMEIKKYQIT